MRIRGPLQSIETKLQPCVAEERDGWFFRMGLSLRRGGMARAWSTPSPPGWQQLRALDAKHGLRKVFFFHFLRSFLLSLSLSHSLSHTHTLSLSFSGSGVTSAAKKVLTRVQQRQRRRRRRRRRRLRWLPRHQQQKGNEYFFEPSLEPIGRKSSFARLNERSQLKGNG